MLKTNVMLLHLLAVSSLLTETLHGQSAARVNSQAKAPRNAKAVVDTTGTIEGDVYYLTRTGDIKKGAGLTVRLFEQPDSLLAALRANCIRWKAEDDSLARELARFPMPSPAQAILGGQNPSEGLRVRRELVTHRRAARTEMRLRADQLLSRAVRESSTGMQAHYRFDDVAPGSYLIHLRWPVQVGTVDVIYQWMSSLSVIAGTALRKDLDTQAENSAQVYCEPKR